jgi:hypothetical protein
MWHYIKQAALGAFAAAGLTLLALETYVVFDLRAFEYEPLLQLLGWEGVTFILFLSLGLALAVYTCLKLLVQGRTQGDAPGPIVKLFLVLWTVAALWMLEWTFMERPLTVRLEESLVTQEDKAAAVQDAIRTFDASGDLEALLGDKENADRLRTAIILQRIRSNAPGVYEEHPIGVTIAKYAKKYEANPILLIYGAYVTSFYGEAVSGRMPFFNAVTGETLRDLIQAHLPWWFVESPVRSWLIESELLPTLAGAEIGNKLRYALHKATYDISQDPFSANTYTDALVILQQYPDQFPELFSAGSNNDALSRAALALGKTSIGQPLADPYSSPKWNEETYRQYRYDLITFARALLYRLYLDFDFAARLQALAFRYYSDHFSAYLGDAWKEMSEAQRVALIAMSRDVYIPNIGRLSANVYALPELTWGGSRFVVQEAKQAGPAVLSTGRIWRPDDVARLWAGAGALLRVLSETWQVMTGQALPGVTPSDSTPESLVVITRQARS